MAISRASSRHAVAVAESFCLSCKHKAERKLTGNGVWVFETSTPSFSDTPRLTRPHLLILTKQFYQPGAKYLNRWPSGGHSHPNHHSVEAMLCLIWHIQSKIKLTRSSPLWNLMQLDCLQHASLFNIPCSYQSQKNSIPSSCHQKQQPQKPFSADSLP